MSKPVAVGVERTGFMGKRELFWRAAAQATIGVFGNAVKISMEALASVCHLPGNLLKVFTACVVDVLYLPGNLLTAFGMWVWQVCAVACYVINPTHSSDLVKNSVPEWVVEMMAVRDQPPPTDSASQN